MVTGQRTHRFGKDRWRGNGLSSADVSERVRGGLTNLVSNASSRSLWDIFRANVLTLFNAIVAGSFVLLLALGQWQDALFGFAAVGNAVIGVVQEYRAKKSLDRLAVLNSPHARVLRDGAIQDIPTAEVVLDDVILLFAGDQVPADATVFAANGLEIDESLLTGESNPVDKEAGSEALAGSSVVGGQGRAQVVRVGDDSFAGKLTTAAKRFSLVNSEIRTGLNRVLRWITWGLLPVMAVVVNGEMQAQGGWNQALATGSWKTAAVGAVASVIAMVPLGLVLMASVAFALGGLRLARDKVLIQELAAVEGLARVDMLCLDKTGTLTEGRIVFDGMHDAGASPVQGWKEALGWFGADPDANATARCLAAVYKDDGVPRPVSSVPFASSRKWSAVSFTDGSAPGTWVLGAPELVLESTTPGHVQALSSAAGLASSGLRTLVLAHAGQPMAVREAEEAALPSVLVPAAILTFREKIRPDAATTLAYFREQGVDLRIISGDDPRTVAAVARDVGLDTADGYDARDLPEDPELMADVLQDHKVFGRVTPAQKKAMVSALRSRGHVVAMTGDGVNDALALKEADIGIAMGTAAAATKAVSRLVLLDGRFDRLPGVVAEGRRVIANIERVSMLFLAKTAYAIALSVVFGGLLWGFPFLPRQLSATDGLTIGIPAFFLALMPNARLYRPGFLKRSLTFAVPAGLIITVAVVALNTYAAIAGVYGEDSVRTGSVMVLALVALWVLVVLSRPLNRWRLLIVASMYAGLLALLTVPVIADFFGISWPPDELRNAALLAALVGCAAVELVFRLRRRLNV
ncbi:cation-transporting ATPase E [Arthrobacter sp. PvP102]|jgi:cation-transporting ATPase E|uniref:HAD-IC family P-type ATPase n=1 Tax=unclassified Arthrobacter TaxID=235627 RepID=UPI00005279A7|nr:MULTISPECIES: HAD-IC family P-type ATPase [unclassified Arthrobacter]ABK04846.1 ATPase, P-type (transporting), HAD superfamily, subfamily IC [Arthrobacter sp. FB24]MBP1232818.1 cation-transporting ATPase E [Arthrobacter sp. PvP103]MBP1237953.1 cation-transporting ATPase E [Arthrobacter sp. PvP102]